ncbi:MAG TPA: chemotaxis protein CheD [Conexibacter sp.]|jgi:chemotaxis protein CheD
MGELAVSATPGDELLSIGLGSCIGVAVVDRARHVAALAHVMLPDAAADPSGPPGKYADRAIPALVAAAEQHGARRVRLEAVLVGGAQMFAVGIGSTLDIGARNATAVKAALQRARIPVRAAEVGGNRGRTMRLLVGAMTVTVKEAGGREAELWSGAPTRAREVVT